MRDGFDVLAIGNAIVDVIAAHDDAFLAANGIAKGGMRLVSADEASALYARMGPAREISGGSAANTAVGVAALGGSAHFVGRVANDQLGTVFAHDIRAAGVSYTTAASANGQPTGQSLIVVTPDAQRSMTTFLGAAQELDEGDIDPAAVRAALVVYFEGYLWDPPAPVRAIRRASDIAKAGDRQVAMTLSDAFCVEGHRADFLGLIETGAVDIVFANETEAKCLFETDSIDDAIAGFAARARLAVVTRSEKGAVVIHRGKAQSVAAATPARVLDTTGAGDLFAAGFLSGFTRRMALGDCAAMGAIAAAEVIEHYGARPEADLQARVAAALGQSATAASAG